MIYPSFAVTQVGSWPRSHGLVKALRDKQKGRCSPADFDRVADEEIQRIVAIQDEVGMDVLVDGELRRDNFYSFITDKLSGTSLMSLAEMLDSVEDKASFEEILTTLDVPASAIRNPTCIGKLQRNEALAVSDFLFLRELTRKPIKITLPGPYLPTRAMWVEGYANGAYRDKMDMGQDVVRILREELSDLRAAGCEFVQFDEPVLTEIVMSGETNRRTFMCATLATRTDPLAELEYASALFNQVVADFSDMRIGLHVCRGNWSRSEEVLLSGDYSRILPTFQAMRADQFVLEFATPRAGELSVIASTLNDRELGLGVINPRTAITESVESIVERVEEALEYYRPEQIFLNPDCGFGCFANRCVNDETTATGKLRAMVAAAALLRKKFC